MRITLHLGYYKTGTTSFQYACAAARVALARRGLLYPAMHGSSAFAENHSDFAVKLLTSDSNLHDDLAELQASAREIDASEILLSSEVFSELAHSEERFLQFHHKTCEFFEPTYVMSIRKPIPLFTSYLFQYVQSGHVAIADLFQFQDRIERALAIFDTVSRVCAGRIIWASYEKTAGATQPSRLLKVMGLGKFGPIGKQYVNVSADKDLHHVAFGSLRTAQAQLLGLNEWDPIVDARVRELVPIADFPEDLLRTIRDDMTRAIETNVAKTIETHLPAWTERYGHADWFRLLFASEQETKVSRKKANRRR